MTGHRRVSVTELEPGMRVAKIIENEFGASLVTPGMILDDNLIEKLSNLGVRFVTIYAESKEKIEKNKENFFTKYKENVNNMKKLFKSVSYGNRVEFNKIKAVVDDIAKIDTNRDIVGLLSQVKDTDEYTYTHSINVGLLAMMFGRFLNLEKKDIKQLLYAGFLHDIGKARISNDILNKEGKLTQAEYNEIKKHPIYGYELLKKCDFISNRIAMGVLLHHERNDGSGYPLGLSKEKIPFIAKVLAIVDTYDAMTSDRVYQGHRPPFEVFKVFEKGIQAYDISLSRLFMNDLSQYYIGEEVELSNGQKGEIVFISPNHISEPIVKVGTNFIDLYKSDLEIKDVFVKSDIDKDFHLYN